MIMEVSILDYIMAFIVNHRFAIFLVAASILSFYIIYLEASHYMLKWRNSFLEKENRNMLAINAEVTRQLEAREETIEKMEVVCYDLQGLPTTPEQEWA